MLKRLYIKNIALISEADVELEQGLNVLSGETGSGKSVILESINFVLGSKADKTMIRYGEQEALVRAEFFVEQDSEALKKLEELDIESDGNIIISRRFNVDGKGGIKINGASVTLSMLKGVTRCLVDVHGQSEHFYLLSEDNQLKVIDGILGADGAKIRAELAELIERKRDFKAKIRQLGGNEAEREREIDLLNYQINEIESANVEEGEFDRLTLRKNIILNTEKIMTALGAAKSFLSDDNGVVDSISAAKRSIGAIDNLSDDYAAMYSRLESLYSDAEDISETLSDLLDGVAFDEREAEEIEERLNLLKGLKKKYGADESEILRFLDSAKLQREELCNGAELAEKLAKQVEETDARIYSLCRELTKLRKRAADGFTRSVVGELKTLNIPSAAFEIDFSDYDEGSADLNSDNGSDSVCFMFSANRGEPLKPMNKVISGGEISRFMLAVKTVLKDVNGISTYIFDEIDAGISGFTAKTVAEKFIAIAKNTQIIAVSHLAQICAASDAQFLIFKETAGGKTLTHIKKLDSESKLTEIVRLLGSLDTAAAREHAKELVNSYKNR